MEEDSQEFFDAVFARMAGGRESSCNSATTSEIEVDEDPDLLLPIDDDREEVIFL